MMATTHVFAGVLVGLAAVAVAPVAATPVLIAAALGGLTPDFDLLGAHRRTLHFPAYGTSAAALATGLAWAVPTTATVALAAFLVAFALHAVSDAFGGGLSLRPWEPSSDRGVYEHLRGRWHRPRRVVRYDGAPEDAFLGLALALPAYALLGPTGRLAVLGLLVVSVVYTVGRRTLVDGGESLMRWLPPGIARRLPESLVGDLR